MRRISRRELLFAAAGAAASAAVSAATQDLAGTVKPIESQLGARIGVSIIDSATRRRIAYRGNERFAMCSTFKAALAAAVLTSADRGRIALERPVSIDPGGILSNSPVTGGDPAPGSLTVRALCAAAVEHSDNTAANLLLSLVGGPAAVTRFFRSLGDRVTRLDRMELALNANTPNDPRDTTSPAAMAASLRAILVEKTTLRDASRQQLIEWMLNEQNGRNRIRAGVPPDWRTANKPGTGGHGAVNDIAVLWPPRRPPLVLAVYTDVPHAATADAEHAIASVARFVAESV